MHTPSRWIFIVSLVLAALALVGSIAKIPAISEYAVWVALIGYLVLTAGVFFKTT